MGYMTNGLTFNTLRGGNTARLPEFRNNKGELSHTPEKDDWTLNDWMTACLGELGEAANILKKVRRGDLTLEEARPLLAQEFSDANIYLDILSQIPWCHGHNTSGHRAHSEFAITGREFRVHVP